MTGKPLKTFLSTHAPSATLLVCFLVGTGRFSLDVVISRHGRSTDDRAAAN